MYKLYTVQCLEWSSEVPELLISIIQHFTICSVCLALAVRDKEHPGWLPEAECYRG